VCTIAASSPLSQLHVLPGALLQLCFLVGMKDCCPGMGVCVCVHVCNVCVLALRDEGLLPGDGSVCVCVERLRACT